LFSARLRLVPLADEHLPLEMALDTDPTVMAYVGGPARSAAAVAESHTRRLALATRRPGLGFWAAFCREDFVGLMMLPPAHGPDQPNDLDVADLGYRLAPTAWDHGFGREAATLLLSHAFDTVGMKRVIAQTRTDNARSRKLLEAIGMRYVRDFRSADDFSDGPLDCEYEVTIADRKTGRERR
jgi:RimJ/RimL family protein N-acetyltransferase